MTPEVRCFSTGRVRPRAAARGVRRYLGGWSNRTLPVNVFLVDHPAGLLLIDAGQTADAASSSYFPRWHPYLRLARFELGPDDEAHTKLRAAGIEPRDVRWVALTHLHTDHAGGIAAFAHAEVLVSRTEWQAASGVKGRLRGYLPDRWPRGLEPALVDCDGPPVGPFAGSFDVAGDGRLLLVPTPGHTRGHLGVLVRAPGRAYLCGGDLARNFAELERDAPEVAAFCRREGVVFLAAHDDGASRLAA